MENITNALSSKILIVDDKPANLFALSAALKKLEAEIITATSGNEALSLLLRHRFAMVILDVNMPGMSGLEVAELMRDNEATRDIPILFITAFSKDDWQIFKGYHVGGADYLLKPIQEPILIQKVRVFLKLNQQKMLLEQTSRELARSNRALEKARSDLERRVEERTADLKRANEHLVSEIHERQRTEERIQRLQTFLESVINSMPSALIGIDLDGRITQWNPVAETLIGKGAEVTRGKSVYRVCPFLEDKQKIIQRIMETADPYTEETIVHWEENRDRFWNMTIYPLVRNGVEGAVIRIDDVTDRVLAAKKQEQFEDNLRKVQKMEAIGNLAGGIAHDFNNILSAIIGYSELLEIAVSGSLQSERYVKQILTASNRAKNLIQQILTFSRKAESSLQQIEIRPVVAEAMKLLRASLPATIEIHEHIAPEVRMVMANPTQIHQILMNLCTNASHAMDEDGGRLDVVLEGVVLREDDSERIGDLTAGEYLRITVSDTGKGIPTEIIERIYEPYFTTKGPDKGTGLGLSVVHGIVQNHGGHITVDSQLEKGTRFCIFLPMLDTPFFEDVTMEAMEDIDLKGSERILLVDDEASIVEIQQQMLEKLGYRVTTTTKGLHALALFTSHPESYDMLITDMTMPHVTGLKLAIQIKKIKPSIPVILCTGYSEAITKEQALAMGIEGFIMKPFDKDSLALTIRKIFEERRAKE